MKAVIFDMDGLLIDSEPYWQEAGSQGMARFNIQLTREQQFTGIGLRTEEWIEHWFHHFKIPVSEAEAAVAYIMQKALQLIDKKAQLFPGAIEAVRTAKEKDLKVAIATSSPLDFVSVLHKKMNLDFEFDAISSAQYLAKGKPHPEVYLNAASALDLSPLECLAVEDSFNGLIAAKAARMKCIAIPHADDYDHQKWGAADARLKTLSEFNAGLLKTFQH